METNLNKIRELSIEREEENWKFRSFLKRLKISAEDLDSIVHKLYHQVSSEIDCTQCANCCKEILPIFDQADIAKFSEGVEISATEFKEQYLKKDNNADGHIFKTKQCPFLENNLCTNYEYRPKVCFSYPHLQKDDFVFRLIGVINNYSICPIVFNVYELLKDELWHRDNDFDF